MPVSHAAGQKSGEGRTLHELLLPADPILAQFPWGFLLGPFVDSERRQAAAVAHWSLQQLEESRHLRPVGFC